MPDRIHFTQNINDSAQIDDMLYVSTLTSGIAGTVEEVGKITGIGDTWVEVADGDAPVGFVAGGTERVLNGDFANGQTNWNMTNATFANNEALVQIPANGDHSYIAQSISFIDGVTYKITFDAKGSATNNIRVQDNYSDTGGLKAADTDIELTTSYQTYEFTWTANSNSNNIVISRNYANQVSWDFYIDNVSIVDENNMSLLFMFRKNNQINISTLVGYFANVTMSNSNTNGAELFDIGSEVFVSSK